MTSEITPEPVPEIKPDASCTGKRRNRLYRRKYSRRLRKHSLRHRRVASPDALPEPLLLLHAPPRTRWQRFLHWEFLGLFIIVLVTLIFHFAQIERPRDHCLG